jgi:transposase
MKGSEMEQETLAHFGGLDWGDRNHVLVVTAEGGAVRLRMPASQSAEGIGQLVVALQGVPGLKGVAIETKRHLLVDALYKAGITVYPINPKLSHYWGECVSVNGIKDDARDAWTLAHGLSLYHRQLRPLTLDDPQMQLLAQLCDQEQRLIADRTALVCQLEAVLKQYFPAILPWFRDWATPGPWNFLQAFPTAQALAKATKQKLCGWFKTHKMRLTPLRLEQIERRKEVLGLAADEPMAQVLALRATTLAAQLNALERGIREHRQRIEALYAQQKQAELFDSLPAAGPKLAPRLMCIFNNCAERYDSASGICEVAGSAPVTQQSGRTTHVRFRRACNKLYRNVMHHYAWVSLRFCKWARVYYRRCIEAGQNNAQALRNLANKWIKIIYRMCCENKKYDEARYIEALRKHGSPIAARLGEGECGKAVENSPLELDLIT